jgi:XTP/dITP diphosphohydrolase
MPLQLTYVTSSTLKKEENDAFLDACQMSNGLMVRDCFSFRYESLSIPERLEINLEKLVREEVFEAYATLKVPCFVEHAGLIVEDFLDKQFPGGLTKAMWNALGDSFLTATAFAGKRAVARACVGYCDGMRVWSFVGETEGKLVDAPRGDRKFYWDTVFEPDGYDLTYAELVKQKGLAYKIQISQSTKAKLRFLEHLLSSSDRGLW